MAEQLVVNQYVTGSLPVFGTVPMMALDGGGIGRRVVKIVLHRRVCEYTGEIVTRQSCEV